LLQENSRWETSMPYAAAIRKIVPDFYRVEKIVPSTSMSGLRGKFP
jgi:hypothetical protein